MNPDILMVNADHDMRNPADMLVLNAVARNVMHTEGIAMVQNITRPLGIPIQHSSIPFQTSISGPDEQHEPAVPAGSVGQPAQDGRRDERLDRHHGEAVPTLPASRPQLTQDSADKSRDLLATTEKLRDHIANFDDTVPAPAQLLLLGTALLRHPDVRRDHGPLFDSLDGIDELTDQTGAVQANTDQLADLAPQLTALLPQTIASMKTSRDLSLASYNSQKALLDQMEASNDTALAMGAELRPGQERRPVLSCRRRPSPTPTSSAG